MRRISMLIVALVFSFNLVFSQEPKLILPIGHFLGVGSAFSPDGKRIVTSGLDYTAKIWEVETGRLLANLSGHTDTLFGANYSPDGKKIVTTCQDGTAKIWDAVNAIFLTDLKGHTGAVSVGEFSPDGKKILTASTDATAKVWDVASGKLLADLRGHTKPIWWAWFSKDGKKIVTCSDDSTAKVWDVETGKMLADLKGHRSEVLFVEFSPDGKKVITGAADSTAKIWDAITGKLLKDISDHKAPVRYTHFSPDGKRFVTASDDGDVKLWNEQTGLLIANIKGKPLVKVQAGPYVGDFDMVRAADFTPDGKRLLTIYQDSATKIWDAYTGKLLVDVKRESIYVNNVSFSKDGERFSLGLASGNAQIYDVNKGTLVIDLKGDVDYIQSFNFGADGKRFLVSNRKRPARLLDAESGALIAVIPSLPEMNKFSRGVYPMFSQDGKKVLVNTSDGVTMVWDAVTGTYLLDLPGSTIFLIPELVPGLKKIVTRGVGDSVCKIWDISNGKLLLDLKHTKERVKISGFSQNGKRMLTYDRDTVYNVWDLETGKIISELKNIKRNFAWPVLNPVGDRLLVSSMDSLVQIWDTNTGSLLLKSKETDSPAGHVDYSPDGKKIILESFKDYNIYQPPGIKILDAETGTLLLDPKLTQYYWNHCFSPDGKKVTYVYDCCSLKTWDFEKKQVVAQFIGHTADVIGIHYSPDEKKIVTASLDGTAKVWEVETGKLLFDLKEHSFWVDAADFSPDGKKIFTRSLDFTAKIWDAETGKSLYTFIPVKEEDYLVLDKFNHFDGTEGARKLLYFTCGTEVIELDQVKDQLWVPNLAERILKGETINAAKLSDLNICNLTPLVDTIEQSSSQYRFRITPRLGGLGSTIVYVNGIEVTRYSPQQLQQQKGEYQLSISKNDLHKYFVSNKENTVTVKALTAKTSISSRSVSISERRVEKDMAPPNLYAVVVGVSDYKGEELDLRFAAKDAVDIGNAIESSAKKLLNTDGNEHVIIYKINTGNNRDRFPEKNAIRQVFTEISGKAKPNDILLVFFAGHGVMESEKNKFYFLTADASNATVSGALKDVGISTEELSDWIKPQVMKAQKRILIFDACNSGQVIKELVGIGQNGQNLLASRGDDKGKQIKAIEKLNERSGMFILSASASDQKAYEMGKYSQGALTYSLLKAIKDQPDILEDRKYLNISRWFNAAEKTVNELARETGTRQQPQLVSTTNFNVGVVDEEVRNKIVLPFEKPMLTRSDLRNADLRIDNLKLRSLVDKELDDISENAAAASIMYNPEYDGADVYTISGDYTVSGNDVTVSVILTKGGTEIKTRFESKGMVDQLSKLATSITAKVIEWLGKGE